MADFPSVLSNVQDDIDTIFARYINNLETKVGIDNSAVVTSIDYLLKNSASSNPGHKHTLAQGATDVVASTAELNYCQGVTSAIQTQLDNKQTLDDTLTSIAALGTAADKLAYTTGIDTWAEAALTAAGRALIDDADAAAQRTTLGAAADADVLKKDGSVAITANWNIDGANTLFIDKTNGRVGIGTTAPGEKLEVYNGNILANRGNLKFTQETAPGAPTVAINTTAGNLNGTYTYKITFVTAQGETQGGTTSASVSPANQQVDLSAIPTGTSGVVTARKIYRTVAGGTQHKLVTTINDNTTTTYTDNIADGSLGANVSTSNTTAAGILVGGTNIIQIDQSGNVGIGTTAPGSKLTIAGAIENVGTPRYYRNVAVYNSDSGSITGTMKIKLPKYRSSTMMQVRIQGYDYSGGRGGWEVIVGGYNYSGSQEWVDYGAAVHGSPPFTTIRLANDGSNDLILLGSTDTAWVYPKVTVSEFIAGYQNLDGWGSGWSISIITDETGIADIFNVPIRIYVDSTGKVGIGTTGPTALLDINSDILRLRTAKTPASAAAAGNVGDICWDANYIYVCTAASAWKRAAIATW